MSSSLLGQASKQLGGITRSMLLVSASQVSVVASSSGVPAYRVIGYDPSTSLGRGACADGIAAARGLLGVSYAPTSAGAIGNARHLGLVEVDVEPDTTPAAGDEVFLSAHRDGNSIGGFVTNELDGTMYPRSLGRFRTGVSGGRAWVKLSIDESRDDDREWLLDIWAPTAHAQSHDVQLSTWWQRLHLEISPCGAGAPFIILRPDGSASALRCSWHGTASGTSASEANIGYGAGGAVLWVQSTIVKLGDGRMAYTSISGDTVSNNRIFWIGLLTPWTAYLRLYSDTADAFRANSTKLTVRGRVDLT